MSKLSTFATPHTIWSVSTTIAFFYSTSRHNKELSASSFRIRKIYFLSFAAH